MVARRLWTAARIAALRDLWSAGQTAAAIGTVLGGITRSAVLGKVFRLRLAPAARGGAAPQTSEDAPARRRAGKPPPQPSETKPRRKTLLDLTNECCRWPYGELGSRRFHFCGAAGADLARGIPYCARHMARAYVIPPSPVARAAKLKLVAGGNPSNSASPVSRSSAHPRDPAMRKIG